MSDPGSEHPGSDSAERLGPAVDPRLLEVLVCPVTKAPLEYDRAAGELISRKAGLAYPIRDGIPIMLPEAARQLED
jgi:uncharacterized protein YbaR (Trm112 family)